ncbi:hypothetical protein V2J09_018219 [Rumex salicifolius]
MSSHDDHLTKDQVADRVLALIKDFPKVDPSKVTSDVHFQKDLGLDSLDSVELVIALEEEFKLEIPDMEADKLESTKLVIEYIYKHPMSISDSSQKNELSLVSHMISSLSSLHVSSLHVELSHTEASPSTIQHRSRQPRRPLPFSSNQAFSFSDHAILRRCPLQPPSTSVPPVSNPWV